MDKDSENRVKYKINAVFIPMIHFLP